MNTNSQPQQILSSSKNSAYPLSESHSDSNLCQELGSFQNSRDHDVIQERFSDPEDQDTQNIIQQLDRSILIWQTIPFGVLLLSEFRNIIPFSGSCFAFVMLLFVHAFEYYFENYPHKHYARTLANLAWILRITFPVFGVLLIVLATRCFLMTASISYLSYFLMLVAVGLASIGLFDDLTNISELKGLKKKVESSSEKKMK